MRKDSGSRARFIGIQPEANVIWLVNRNLILYAVYSVVEPGQFIADTGPNRTLHFVATHAIFEF